MSHCRSLVLSLALVLSMSSSVHALPTTVQFLKGVVQNLDKVGTIFPCSRFVGREIASVISHENGPLRILELGAGTGALTKQIRNAMHEGDKLDLIEILPDYCQELTRLFGHDSDIAIHCCSVLDWQPAYKYDVIVCSLPFNIFEPEFVQSILDHTKRLIKPDGHFSYVELMGLAKIKKLFLRGKSKDVFAQTRNIMHNFRTRYGVKESPIYFNITPIYVYHLRIDDAGVMEENFDENDMSEELA